MYRISGYQFYNTSEFTLKELCNDADHIEANAVIDKEYPFHKITAQGRNYTDKLALTTSR